MRGRRHSTLLNSYFVPIKSDSVEGIFEFCKEAAVTYSFGGGLGTDISIIRPKGAREQLGDSGNRRRLLHGAHVRDKVCRAAAVEGALCSSPSG